MNPLFNHILDSYKIHYYEYTQDWIIILYEIALAFFQEINYIFGYLVSLFQQSYQLIFQ